MTVGRNSIVYMSLSYLQKAISFIMLPILTYYISPSGMGKITLLTTMIPLLAIFFSFALYGAGTTLMYRFNDDEITKRLWGNINLATNFVGILFLLFFSFTYKFVLPLVEGFSYRDYFILLLATFFSTIYNQFQSYLESCKLVRLYFRNALSFTIVNIFFILLFVIILKNNYRGYFYSILFTYFLFYIFSMIYAIKNFKFKLDFNLIKQSMRFSIPLIPHLTFGMLLAYSDRLFVNKYMGNSELGIYGVACQCASVFQVIVSGFVSAYSPFSFENYASKNYLSIVNFCQVTLVYFSIFIFCVSVYSNEIFIIIVKKSFIEGWVVVPLFAISYMFMLGYIFFVNYLFYTKPWLVNIVTISAGCLNICLNYFITKKFGMIGATLCTMISYFASMIIVYNISKHLQNIGFNFVRILLFQFIIIVMILTTYILHGFHFGFRLNLVVDSIFVLFGVVFIWRILTNKILNQEMNLTLNFVKK